MGRGRCRSKVREKAVGAQGTGHLWGLLHKGTQCVTSVVCTVLFMGVIPDPFPRCMCDWVFWSSVPPSYQCCARTDPNPARSRPPGRAVKKMPGPGAPRGFPDRWVWGRGPLPGV